MDWQDIEAHWADAQLAVGNRRGRGSCPLHVLRRSQIARGARRVAEYCWVPPLPRPPHAPEAEEAEDGSLLAFPAQARKVESQRHDINMTRHMREARLHYCFPDSYIRAEVRLRKHVSGKCNWVFNPDLGSCRDEQLAAKDAWMLGDKSLAVWLPDHLSQDKNIGVLDSAPHQRCIFSSQRATLVRAR